MDIEKLPGRSTLPDRLHRLLRRAKFQPERIYSGCARSDFLLIVGRRFECQIKSLG